MPKDQKAKVIESVELKKFFKERQDRQAEFLQNLKSQEEKYRAAIRDAAVAISDSVSKMQEGLAKSMEEDKAHKDRNEQLIAEVRKNLKKLSEQT